MSISKRWLIYYPAMNAFLVDPTRVPRRLSKWTSEPLDAMGFDSDEDAIQHIDEALPVGEYGTLLLIIKR